MSEPADAEPVRAALAAHRDELIGFVRRRAGHILDPEDVVHRAAARALARAGGLRDPGAARAWLYRIVRNELSDELRRAGLPVGPAADADAIDQVADPEPSPLAPGRPCQCALDLRAELRPEYARILERTVVDEVPVVEVARELGITANNAMVRLHRARKALRAAIAARCGTTSLHDCLDCACDDSGVCCATR